MKKRILLIIPLIMLMIVSICPLSVAAEVAEDDAFPEYEKYAFSNFESNLDEDSKYFYINAHSDTWNPNNCYTIFYDFTSRFDSSRVVYEDFSDGIYIMLMDIDTIIRYYSSSGSPQNLSTKVRGIRYDTNDNIFYYTTSTDFSNNYENVSWSIPFRNDTTFGNLKTTLFDTSDLGLEVSFLPINFSGNVGETYNIGNTTAQLYQIDMEVINHSNQNYQYLWCIVPHGNSLSFIDNNVDCQTKGFVGSPSWVFSKNEWCITINPDAFVSGSSWGSSSSGHAPIQSTYLPCAWHFVSSHSSESNQVCIKNMKLFSGHQYDCLVYAVPTSSDKLTLVDSYYTSSGNEIFSTSQTIQYSSVQCIYSSTFTLGFDTPFDKDYNAAGVLSFDPDSNLDDFFTSSSARYNPDTHELEIGYDIRNNVRNNNYFNSYSSSSDSYSLVDNTRSVFLFVSSTFSYFPSDFLKLFYFGFATLILIAILKAAR